MDSLLRGGAALAGLLPAPAPLAPEGRSHSSDYWRERHYLHRVRDGHQISLSRVCESEPNTIVSIQWLVATTLAKGMSFV